MSTLTISSESARSVVAIPRLASTNYTRTAFRRDRVGLLLKLARERQDIVELSLGLWRNVVTITSSALAHEALVSRQSAFVKSPGLTIFFRPVLGDGLLTSEKAMHERQRRLLAPAFAPKRIAGYGATMADRTRRFVARIAPRAQREGGAPIDLAPEMMRLTFDIVGKTLFDAELLEDAADVGEALSTTMEIAMDQLTSSVPIPPMIPTPKNLRYRRAVSRLDALVYGVIERRRREGGDRGDVLSMLLLGESGREMTDRQVRDEAMTLVLAGHETTANALAWTFHLLALNPEVRAKVEAEVDALGHDPEHDDLKKLPYTLAVLKEAMRLYPPAYIIGRRATTDFNIGDHVVKKRTIVLVNVIGIHRRADVWSDPERFDPDRFMGDKEKLLPRAAYLPFGAGSRVCIGNHFALMEGHLALATIARSLRIDHDQSSDVGIQPLITLRPAGSMPMRVEARR